MTRAVFARPAQCLSLPQICPLSGFLGLDGMDVPPRGKKTALRLWNWPAPQIGLPEAIVVTPSLLGFGRQSRALGGQRACLGCPFLGTGQPINRQFLHGPRFLDDLIAAGQKANIGSHHGNGQAQSLGNLCHGLPL